MTVQIPLCVNPEGTLFKTSTLLESILLLLKQKPLAIFWLPVWRLRGKSVLKRELAARVSLDFGSLPANGEFISFLKHERENGRKIVLVTDANLKTAADMAAPFGFFDSWIGGHKNGNGSHSDLAALLQERFGAKQFDYAGNGRGDSEIRNAARNIIPVAALGSGPERGTGAEVNSPPAPTKWRAWTRALRLYQWPKNLLLLAPLAFAHAWHDTTKLLQVGLALAAFCLCASSVYILNDLMDLDSDRHHPQKRHRPFAAGTIPLGSGLAAVPLLLAVSILIAAFLPLPFLAGFALYYLLTLAYSLHLKQVAVLDVLLLAGLYSLRVIAGGLAAQIRVTDWLLAFSMFLFLSLAFVKRFTELQMAKYANKETLKGRGYVTSDIELVSSMGVSCGYLSVLVLAFYINNPDVAKLYHRPTALWLACPVLLYWISRIWLLAHRQLLHEDPIVFTLTDKQSWLIAIIFMLIAAAAAPL
jgi:4-hydroxybenzoate polyprenyltransferase